MSILKYLITEIKRKKQLENDKPNNSNNKSYLGNQTVEFVKIANKARNQKNNKIS
jgi:hypothetical protein